MRPRSLNVLISMANSTWELFTTTQPTSPRITIDCATSPSFIALALLKISFSKENPLSCHFYYKDYDGNIYVAYEHYESGKSVDYHAEKILKIAKDIGWSFRSDGRLEALIDSASNQRTLSSEKSVAELFYERGIAVNTRVNKDLFTGISKVRELFASRPPQVFVFKNCVNFIREIKGYSWGQNDSPIKRDDHAMDEFRYYVMANLINLPPRARPNLLLRHKQRLIRARRRK